MKTEKHCSVIDAVGRHVTYVLVKIRDKPLEDGGTEQVEEVQNYTLKDGEHNHHVMPKNNVPDVLCLPQKQYFCENEKQRWGLDGNISSA